MPIDDYEGVTFVAFVDISGFKQLLRRSQSEAARALDRLYQAGYDVLWARGDEGVRVDGIFVSDCGVLFARLAPGGSKRDALVGLLEVIEAINRELLDADLMLTGSIAFGPFRYARRIEFPGISKNMALGGAYVAAFADHEGGRPKLRPGFCRIVLEEEDVDFWREIEAACDGVLSRVSRVAGDRRHLQFFWMVQEPQDIDEFVRRHKEADDWKYRGMRDALRWAVSR